MAFSNYTLPSGLKVHPIYMSQTEEDGRVTQDRFWAIVIQIGDPSYVHARIDIDVLQPKFQGLHYGTQTLNELGRRKRRRTEAAKKEEAKEARKNEEWDSLAQCWDCVEWEQN